MMNGEDAFNRSFLSLFFPNADSASLLLEKQSGSSRLAVALLLHLSLIRGRSSGVGSLGNKTVRI